MAWRKPLFIAALVLVVLAATGAIALRLLVDPEKVKTRVQEFVRANWGKELRIDSVELHYLPLPSVRVHGVTLDDPAVAIEQIDMRASLIGLLMGKVRDVRMWARIVRNGQSLDVDGQLDDPRAESSQGELRLAWNETRARATGRFPLARSLDGHDLQVEASSNSLDDVFAFLGLERGKTAPVQLKATSRGVNGRADITDLALDMGDLHVRGDLQVLTGDKRAITGNLTAQRIDWLQALEQSGGKIRPKHHDGEIFHADPVAWHALSIVGMPEASIELRVGSLRLGNGLELKEIATRATLGDGKVALEPLSLSLMSGTAKGSMRFDTTKKSIRADIDGDKLLLEQWFRQRGSKLPFTGGSTQLKAHITLTGDTYRELASSIQGPVSMQVSHAKWSSPKAGEIEEMMVDALASRDAKDLSFECIAANLDFKAGRAEGKHIVGARTDVSQLLTAGTIDFREEKIDLRGRVQAKKGVTLGIAALAGGIRISGRLAKPHVGMDPDEKPALLARAAAAVATAGASLLGEALLNAAARDDPCEAVFK